VLAFSSACALFLFVLSEHKSSLLSRLRRIFGAAAVGRVVYLGDEMERWPTLAPHGEYDRFLATVTATASSAIFHWSRRLSIHLSDEMECWPTLAPPG